MEKLKITFSLKKGVAGTMMRDLLVALNKLDETYTIGWENISIAANGDIMTVAESTMRQLEAERPSGPRTE